MSDDLHYITATEAITAFRKKNLSPVELMDAVIARIEAINQTLNAFTYTFFDRARDQAKAAEMLTGQQIFLYCEAGEFSPPRPGSSPRQPGTRRNALSQTKRQRAF